MRTRRAFGAGAFATLMALGNASRGQPQGFPNRLIKFVVGTVNSLD